MNFYYRRSLNRAGKNIKSFGLRQYHLPIVSCGVNSVENVDAGKAKFPRNSQKFAKFSDLSARPKTSFITIILSIVIFWSLNYHHNYFYLYAFEKKSSKVSNSSKLFGYIKFTSTLKQSIILSSLSLGNDIFESQYASFMTPNILFLANFCTNVVFRYPLCPTIKIFSSNLES